MSAIAELIAAVFLKLFGRWLKTDGPPRGSAAETQAKWLMKRAELNANDRSLLEEFEDAIRDPAKAQQITLGQLMKRHPGDPVLEKRVTLLMAYEFLSPVGIEPGWTISDKYEPWMPGPPHPHTTINP